MEGIGAFLPLILIFGVFYILLIRPQQKKIKLHREMLNNLKRGDKVVTSGGIIGKITKVYDNKEMNIEISDQIEIKIAPGMISDLYTLPVDIKNKTETNKLTKPSMLSSMFGNKKKD